MIKHYLLVVLLLTSCVAKFDQVTYQNLTYTKPEVLQVYSKFTNKKIYDFEPTQLKLAQIYEYEKGKNTNDEVCIMVGMIKNRFDRDVNERVTKCVTNMKYFITNSVTNVSKIVILNNRWSLDYLKQKQETMEMMWDIAIKSEASKPR